MRIFIFSIAWAILFIATETPVAYDASRKRIIVIDTEINFNGALSKFRCPDGHADVATKSKAYPQLHGTQVTTLLVDGLDHSKVCVTSIKAFPSDGYSIEKALQLAIPLKPLLINISGGGPGTDVHELTALTELTQAGTLITTAAGNNGENLDTKCNYFPACYRLPDMFAVGSYDTSFSNTGNFLYWESGIIDNEKGTSFASPRKANRLLKERGFGL